MPKKSGRPPGFAQRPNRDGKSFRYYWQPTPRQRRWGFRGEVRLPDGLHEAYAACRAKAAEAEAAIAGAIAVAAAASAAPPGGASNEPKPARPSLSPHERRALDAVPGTLAHAIARFKTKKRYLQRAAATREFYDYVLGIVGDWGGHLRMRAIDEDTIVKLHEVLTVERGPRVANAVVERLRYLFKVAQRKGEIEINPCYSEDLVLNEIAPSGIPWPRPAVPIFVARADAMGHHSIGTAIMLDEWFGQRESDLLDFPRALYRKGVLYFFQSKTGAIAPLTISSVPKLVERIEAELARQRARGVVAGPGSKLILRETTGLPWDRHAFGYAFAHIRAEVAAEHAEFELDCIPKRMVAEFRKNPEKTLAVAAGKLVFKDLRHTAILRLHEAGVGFDDIREITGHEAPATVWDHYLMASAASTRTAFAQRRQHEEG